MPSVNETRAKPVQSTLPFYKRALIPTRARKEDKNFLDKAVSRTWGEVGGFGIAAISVAKFVHGIVNRSESSFWGKYVAPLFGVLLGTVVASLSKKPENQFEVDLIRDGISGVLAKTKKVISQGDLTKTLFSEENKDEIKRAIDSILSTSSPLIRKSLENLKEIIEGQKLNGEESSFTESEIEFINKALEQVDLQGKSEGLSIDGIRNFIEENKLQFSQFIARHPEFYKNVQDAIFSKDNQSNVSSLIASLNKTLEPIGIILDFGFKDKKFNLYFQTQEVFCDSNKPGKQYRPFLGVSTSFEILTALSQLSKRLKELEVIASKNPEAAKQMVALVEQEFLSTISRGLITFETVNLGYLHKNKNAPLWQRSKDSMRIISKDWKELLIEGYIPILDSIRTAQAIEKDRLSSSTEPFYDDLPVFVDQEEEERQQEKVILKSDRKAAASESQEVIVKSKSATVSQQLHDKTLAGVLQSLGIKTLDLESKLQFEKQLDDIAALLNTIDVDDREKIEKELFKQYPSINKQDYFRRRV